MVIFTSLRILEILGSRRLHLYHQWLLMLLALKLLVYLVDTYIHQKTEEIRGRERRLMYHVVGGLLLPLLTVPNLLQWLKVVTSTHPSTLEILGCKKLLILRVVGGLSLPLLTARNSLPSLGVPLPDIFIHPQTLEILGCR